MVKAWPAFCSSRLSVSTDGSTVWPSSTVPCVIAFTAVLTGGGDLDRGLLLELARMVHRAVDRGLEAHGHVSDTVIVAKQLDDVVAMRGNERLEHVIVLWERPRAHKRALQGVTFILELVEVDAYNVAHFRRCGSVLLV